MPLSFSASLLSLPLLQANLSPAVSFPPGELTSVTLQYHAAPMAVAAPQGEYYLSGPRRQQLAAANSDNVASGGMLQGLSPGLSAVLSPSVSVAPVGAMIIYQLQSAMHLIKPTHLAPVAIPVATTVAPVVRRTATGIASWYQTYPGTCASLMAPRGTTIYITNLENGATTSCVVADSGPYVSGRIIDLATDVFSRIAGLQSGLTLVRVTW